jgi:membrane associated rhomboid family serine protease
MLPLSDDNSQRRITPYINYLLIVVNVIVFIFLQGLGSNEAFLMSFSTVPQEILTNTDIISPPLGVTPIPVYGTILTSMFMHGSIAHIAGNMLYLWIFGDNLENAMGHLRYLMFYLICGIIASLSHVLMSSLLGSSLLAPSLGASGAISGVLGGYLILFPRNKIRVFAFVFVITVPAIVTLGIWIIMQVVSQMNAMGAQAQDSGGVAYAAHIGGFFAGMLLVKFFARTQPSPQQFQY